MRQSHSCLPRTHPKSLVLLTACRPARNKLRTHPFMPAIPQLHGRNDNKRLRHGIFVRDGKVDMGFESGWNNGPKAAKGRAGELNGGPSGRQIYHPKVTKENPVAKSGSERLGAGFLGGKALCVGGGRVGAAFGELSLSRGENAVKKTVAMARHGALDATDVNEIGADTENHVTGPNWQARRETHRGDHDPWPLACAARPPRGRPRW